MPLLAIDMTPDGGLTGLDALGETLSGLPPAAPIIVMVHGYKYDPASPDHVPHDHIFGMRPATGRFSRRMSWPRHLGVGAVGGDEPLCIGFGWPARGSIWKAWKRSARAAQALAQLLDHIAFLTGRPTHVIGHSLGARVALRAMAVTRPGSVGRVISLAGGALRSEALRAMDAPGGAGAEVVNVVSRENDVFDAMLELVVGLPDRTVGSGLGQRHVRWLDIQIDHDETRAGLARMGYEVSGADLSICHWSVYLRPGLFPLYRALMDDPRRMPLALIAAHLPDDTQPRWTRLWEQVSRARPFRGPGKAAPGR